MIVPSAWITLAYAWRIILLPRSLDQCKILIVSLCRIPCMSYPSSVITDDSCKCLTLNPVACGLDLLLWLLLLKLTNVDSPLFLFCVFCRSQPGKDHRTSRLVSQRILRPLWTGGVPWPILRRPPLASIAFSSDCSDWPDPRMPFQDFAVRSQRPPSVCVRFPPGSPYLVQCLEFPCHIGCWGVAAPHLG